MFCNQTKLTWAAKSYDCYECDKSLGRLCFDCHYNMDPDNNDVYKKGHTDNFSDTEFCLNCYKEKYFDEYSNEGSNSED